MGEDVAVAQARELLRALQHQVGQISQQLENVERQNGCTSRRGSDIDRRLKVNLRGDLYEAHRHIEALRRRFPDIVRVAVGQQTALPKPSGHHSDRPATSRS